jgi:16S rRNA (cytidine1402-2'-O)-methyltransferase
MGRLYLVATPIGNLEDVSLRALRVLQDVHMVACEDTRHTQILLRKHEIRAKHLTSYTEFNHRRKAAELVGQMDRGWDVALVTDAGTPGLSDPGEHLDPLQIAGGAVVLVGIAIAQSLRPTDRRERLRASRRTRDTALFAQIALG